jgi:hypothetical protein
MLGPAWNVPPNTDLSNCAPGEAPDGTLLVGVRHHNGEKPGSADSVFRIQTVRRATSAWEAPVTVYATTDRDHAAWEPVFYRSLGQKPPTLRVLYSLERPSTWAPAACAAKTNFPGADIANFSVGSAPLCQGRCVGEARCAAWSWRRADARCWLKAGGHGTAADPALDSGSKLCGMGAVAGSGVAGRREQDIVVQESADSGRSWGPVRAVSSTTGSRDGMPSVVRQADGCITVVFEGFGGTAWGAFTVNSVRSCDDGGSWVRQPVDPYPATREHAPTIALLGDGRAAVASYDHDGSPDTQLQLSADPLVRTADPRWSAPALVVDGPATWPNVFTVAEPNASSSSLWVAYGRGGSAHVAGPLATGWRD